jgi:uncharacterized protein YjbI with pentapeptide repeats
MATVVMLGLLSFGTFQGKPERYWEKDRDLRALAPWVLHGLGYDVFIDFREQNVSRLPENYWTMESASDIRRAIQGAQLKKTDLRYADMFRAFMAKVNLRNADLRGSRLRDADFREADLRGANLEGADLRKSDFRAVDFREANLVRASFGRTDLTMSQLGKTDMREADFEDAALAEADMRCADLRGAVNLDPAELGKVKTLYRAELDPDLKKQMVALDSSLFDKPKDAWHDMLTPFNIDKKDICE